MPPEGGFEPREPKTDPLESILGSIMTAEEYSRLEHPTPYVFELSNGEQKLVYFGSPHRSNLEDPLFSEIEQAFWSAHPDMVLVEGMSVRGDHTIFDAEVKQLSREALTETMGEPGFTVKLALEQGIDWYSPEPDDRDLFTFLLSQGFSRDEVFAWEILQVLPQYLDRKDKPGFRDYAEKFIQSFQRNTGWEGFDYSYEQALKIGEHILGQSVDVEGAGYDTAIDFIDPIPWEATKDSQTRLNRISEQASLFRDRKIVSEIAETLKKYKHIFVVYGSSHAAMQEPALRKLFKR